MIDEQVIDKIARAIAKAEGFFVPDSRPARNHNPGDFESDLTGKAVAHDGPYVIYASDDDGWDCLRTQVRLMFKGSHIYTPQMSIMEVAQHYTATDQVAWAKIVADSLQVLPSTKLSQLVPS